jgi:hypothetical protein
MNRFRGEGDQPVNWLDLMPFPDEIRTSNTEGLSRSTALILLAVMRDPRTPQHLQLLFSDDIKEAERIE